MPDAVKRPPDFSNHQPRRRRNKFRPRVPTAFAAWVESLIGKPDPAAPTGPPRDIVDVADMISISSVWLQAILRGGRPSYELKARIAELSGGAVAIDSWAKAK